MVNQLGTAHVLDELQLGYASPAAPPTGAVVTQVVAEVGYPGATPASSARVTQLLAEVAYPGDTPASSARVTQLLSECAYVPVASGVLANYGSSVSGMIGLIFSVGQPTGPIWSATYGSQIGDPGIQEAFWQFTSFATTAILIEDLDGVPPSGSVTRDVTPSFSWPVPSGATGPFLYSWRVHSGSATGTVVVSGSTIDQPFVQVQPALTVGFYVFELGILSGSGASGMATTTAFTIIAPQRGVPFLLASLPPADLRRVDPVPPDYIRYLPQWHAVHGTATQAASASRLFQLLTPPIVALQVFGDAVQVVQEQAALDQVPLNLPRLAWHLQTNLTARDAPLFVVKASGDVREIRRPASLAQFLAADDPVMLLSDQGHIVFRNLATRQVRTAPISGSTGATGAALLTLANRYALPFEGAGIVPDTDVLFAVAGIDWRIRAGSPCVDPEHALVQLTDAFSGTVTFQYQSETFRPVVQVAVSGQPWRTPSETDLWNRLDELALLAALARRPGEDNRALKRRLQVSLWRPPGTDRIATTLAVATELALVADLAWDGQQPLDLAGSGFVGVRQVTIPGFPEIGDERQELVPDGHRRWSGGRRCWEPGSLVTLDGHVVGSASYPGFAVSGNTVDFGRTVSGTVVAHYRYRNYLLERSGTGTITTVLSSSGNMVSGDYRVLLARGVQLSQPADPGFQAEQLLNPDGTPNARFKALAEVLLQHSPVHLARARWGPAAYWLDGSEPEPQVAHVPVIYDRFT